jgi:hypothetical protein
VRSTRSGEATQTDEYVPMIVPYIRAKTNPLRLSGPQKKSAMSTIITVDETKSDRRIVSHIEVSIIDENELFFEFA